ncbi:MAG: hypothetical protein AAF682_17800 [Planctomycetota bacterium]
MPQSSLGDADWFSVGLVLTLLGGFLLANAIVFRSPKGLVREHFRGARPQLRSIRDYVFHRVQVHLGFLFLLAGFGLQLYGHHNGDGTPGEFPVLAIGVVALVVVALEIGGWWLSHVLFRNYLRDYFLQNPPDFETDIELAREVGALFDMRSSGDETVQSYVERLRRKIGLPVQGRRERGPRTPEAPADYGAPGMPAEVEEDLA